MKKSTISKFLCISLSALMLFGLFGCAPRKIDPKPKPGEEVDYSQYYDQYGRLQLIKDNAFANGFMVSAPNAPVFSDLAADGYAPYPLSGNLDHNGTAKNPYWSISQHASSYSLVDPKYKTAYQPKEGVYVYATPGSSVAVDIPNKTVELYSICSNEYSTDDNHDGVRDGVNAKLRTGSENWVHLLLESTCQNPTKSASESVVMISDLDELSFEVDFTLTRHVDYTPSDSRFAAQLTMYFQLYSKNAADTGRYIWYGISMFDSRYSLGSSATGLQEASMMLDAGTNCWMYGTGSVPVLGVKEVKIGTTYRIRHKMLNNSDSRMNFRTVLQQIQARGDMKNTTYEDLYIGAFNIGWEMTDRIDASFSLKDFSVWATYKDQA